MAEPDEPMAELAADLHRRALVLAVDLAAAVCPLAAMSARHAAQALRAAIAPPGALERVASLNEARGE